MEEMCFETLAPVEVPVKIGSGRYVLREASGDAACRYQNAVLKTTKLGPDGRPTDINGLADCEPLLVSLCLFEIVHTTDSDPPKYRPVPLSVIRSWPNRIQRALFRRAQEISGLAPPEAGPIEKVADGSDDVESGSLTRDARDARDNEGGTLSQPQSPISPEIKRTMHGSLPNGGSGVSGAGEKGKGDRPRPLVPRTG
jgi:hypothetical protein